MEIVEREPRVHMRPRGVRVGRRVIEVRRPAGVNERPVGVELQEIRLLQPTRAVEQPWSREIPGVETD